MKLNRNEIKDKYAGKYTSIDIDNKEEVNNYLNDMLEFINNHEYESDSDFVFCGRKRFIYDEINEIVSGIKTVDNPIYFILGSLDEFICNNNVVYISDTSILEIEWKNLLETNDRYSSKGIICAEEINIIKDIIMKLLNYNL